MRPEWRLATSSLSALRSRSILLALTVALSAALIAAVSCAMHSIQSAARIQAGNLVGSADAWIKPLGTGAQLDDSLSTLASTWPEVATARGRSEAALSLSAQLTFLEPTDDAATTFRRSSGKVSATTVGIAIADISESDLTLLAGTLPKAKGEIVIDEQLARGLTHRWMKAGGASNLHGAHAANKSLLLDSPPEIPETSLDPAAAEALNARVGIRLGDTIQIAQQALPDVNISAVLADPARARALAKEAGIEFSPANILSIFAKPLDVKVVGIGKSPPFGGRWRCYTTLETLAWITRQKSPGFAQIDLRLREGVSAETFVEAHASELPTGVIMQPSARVTSGLDQNIQASRLGFILGTVMAFLCAAFIITTGMSTGILERIRELAMLRCVGATRAQLARSQLLSGAILGIVGAIVGIPLGLAIAWVLIELIKTRIEVRFEILPLGLVAAGLGAVLSGVLGAAYPAWRAARVSPLEALSIRAAAPSRRGWIALLLFAVACLIIHIAIVTLTTNGQVRFWTYVTLGIPVHFFGYFALSVPIGMGVVRLLASPISRVLRLPRTVVARELLARRYRFGFTAGSMMMGLSLLVGLWTQGAAIQRDWIGKLEFPDAFVTGLNLSERSQELVNALPEVKSTCAITLRKVETDTFGVQALQSYRSTFMAFEPETFFDMVHPQWVQGDPITAIRRLNEGGAVVVAREFMVARGLGVGDTFQCSVAGKPHDFEIVGVVTSPGLEVVSQFFNIGEDFTEQSLHAVFGSRKDLKAIFGSDAIHLLQIQFNDAVDDEKALARIREILAGAGVLDAGSGRAIKNQILEFVRGGLLASSAVAVAAMLIAGLGVANLIIAGIESRRYEFGVLRAVGASRWLVSRLVLAEAILVAITAGVLGTLMGMQGVYAIQRIDELLFGLLLHLRPPPVPIAVGWGLTLLFTVGAAVPAVLRLARRQTRELLAAAA